MGLTPHQLAYDLNILVDQVPPMSGIDIPDIATSTRYQTKVGNSGNGKKGFQLTV